MTNIPSQDELLEKRQHEDDRDAFGRRPINTVEGTLDNNDRDESSVTDYTPAASKKSGPTLADIDRLLEARETQPSGEAQFPGATPNFRALNVDSGTSVMNAWLETSAIPDEQALPPSDSHEKGDTELHREEWDIEKLRRVQLTAAVESKPLTDTVAEYQELPLDTQIYVRKVVDRFPDLPPFLAKRFASSNADRAKRLRGAQQLATASVDGH